MIDGTEQDGIEDDGVLQPEDTLIDRGVDDVLDEGYSPPEQPLGVTRFGTTVAEQLQGESLDQRLAEEVPGDLFADEGAPNEDAGEIDEVGDRRAGRLVAPDEGAHADYESRMLATDVGIDGAAASAEEAAVHIIEE